MTVSNTTSVKVSPKAQVVHMKSVKGKGSLVIIQLGNIKVAGGVLGGTYSEEQALSEFKKGNRFLKVVPGLEELAETVRNMIP